MQRNTVTKHFWKQANIMSFMGCNPWDRLVWR